MMREKTLEPRRRAAGFSLIELLIVVAIILIIAAIAIPNLLRSRMAANESATVASLRTINTGAITYSTTYRNGFPPSLGALGPPAAPPATCDNADLIDARLAGNVPPAVGGSVSMTSSKSGYFYTYAGAGGNLPAAGTGCAAAGFNGYTVNADPGQNRSSAGSAGQRSFFTNHTLVIRFNVTAVAAVGDVPIS